MVADMNDTDKTQITENGVVTLLDLPSEILLLVVSSLDAEDVLALRKVRQ